MHNTLFEDKNDTRRSEEKFTKLFSKKAIIFLEGYSQISKSEHSPKTVEN